MKSLSQSVQWHITEVCRNRCKHCYISDETNEKRRKKELDFGGLLRILHNFDEFERKYDIGIDNFTLTGGDPFEHPDFEKLLKELFLRNKKIKILGIPERISRETLKMLENYHVSTYQVSLDGMRNTHDMIRGQGSFDKTIHAIKIINKYSNIQPHIMFTIHKQNYQEMFELIDFLDHEEVAVSFSFDFLVLEGSAKEHCNLLNKNDVDVLLLEYRKRKMQLAEHKSKLILREKVKLFETFDIENANEKFKKYTYVSGCYCGISSVAVLPNGDLLPCRRLPIKIGNLLQDNYGELFFNNEILRKLRRISSYHMCGDCDYAKVCRGCPALCYSSTGDAFGEMIYCNRKKTIKPLLCEPSIDCSEKEELAYVTNNFVAAIQKEGVINNMEVVKYFMYKQRMQ